MFEVKFHTYWADADPARIVFFPHFFRFIEQADEELFRAAGTNRQQLFEQNDFDDIGHSSVAAAYCDVFLTERKFTHILRLPAVQNVIQALDAARAAFAGPWCRGIFRRWIVFHKTSLCWIIRQQQGNPRRRIVSV